MKLITKAMQTFLFVVVVVADCIMIFGASRYFAEAPVSMAALMALIMLVNVFLGLILYEVFTEK